ncbi:MAG: fasciclin domain-containing protein [Acidobacteriota bacterium]
MPRFASIALACLCLLFSVTVAAAPHGDDHHNKGHDQDIVDVAASNEDFETLVTAVKAAGLVDTLKGDGPFTVFAPTDDAFAALPAGVLDSLLADTDKLKAVLTYHVVAGKVTAADVMKLDKAATVNGQKVKIDSSSGVKVNNATVVMPDIMTSNGVIHVIDTVLVPDGVL